MFCTRLSVLLCKKQNKKKNTEITLFFLVGDRGNALVYPNSVFPFFFFFLAFWCLCSKNTPNDMFLVMLFRYSTKAALHAFLRFLVPKKLKDRQYTHFWQCCSPKRAFCMYFSVCTKVEKKKNTRKVYFW